MIRERETVAVPGLPVLVGSIALIVLSGYQIVQAARDASASMVVGWSLALVAAILILAEDMVLSAKSCHRNAYQCAMAKPGISMQIKASCMAAARLSGV